MHTIDDDLDQDALGAAIESATAEVEQNELDGGSAAPGAATAAVGAPAPEPMFDPPQRWSNEAKEAWKALHGYPDSRAHIERVHQQISENQKWLTHQEQRRAELERSYQPINDLMTPYAREWAKQGMDPVSGLRQVMAYADALANDPQGTLLHLAQEYGIDLRAALEEQPYVDPATQQLQQQVQELRAHIASQSDHSRQSQQQALIQEIQAFESMADESGNPKHPYFRQVFNDMLTLSTMGRVTTPAEAYEMACRYNPDVQAHMAKSAQERANQDALRRAQTTTQRTQQALAVSGTAKGNGVKAPGAPSMDDFIAAQL